MKKLTAVFSLLFVFFGSVFYAESMLKISALSGEVDCSISGADWKPAGLNQTLGTSDKIRTKNGKAELLFAEGTTVRLKENSLLDLFKVQCAPQNQNSSLKIFFGGIKAKVTKLGEGGSFDVSSPKIIAAVKGTEFVMDTTGEATDLQVLEGIVSVSELLSEKQIFVKENERAVYRDGLLENPRQMDPAEILGIRESFDVSGRNAPGFGGADVEANVKELKELRNDLADLKDRSNLEDKQDLLERISDVQLGKSAIDMHGYRVRTDNYVLRPLPNVLQLLNITKREGGPDAGISSFEINDTFNKNLPSNYMDVKVALKDKIGWLEQGRLPEYYLTSETSAIRNPHGDVILDTVILSQPLWNAVLWEQPFQETFSINAASKWEKDYSAAFQVSYKDCFGTSTGTVLPYTVATPVLTSDGGIKYKDTFADGTYLEKYLYLIDEIGTVQSLANFGKPDLLWEMIYKATEFGTRSIDLIVLPEILNELY